MVEGQTDILHPPPPAPRDVALGVPRPGRPAIYITDPHLVELVEWRYPDALDIDYQPHSETAVTVHVLDLDMSYDRWIASLSLDGRWTLSPVYVK